MSMSHMLICRVKGSMQQFATRGRHICLGKGSIRGNMNKYHVNLTHKQQRPTTKTTTHIEPRWNKTTAVVIVVTFLMLLIFIFLYAAHSRHTSTFFPPLDLHISLPLSLSRHLVFPPSHFHPGRRTENSSRCLISADSLHTLCPTNTWN